MKFQNVLMFEDDPPEEGGSLHRAVISNGFPVVPAIFWQLCQAVTVHAGNRLNWEQYRARQYRKEVTPLKNIWQPKTHSSLAHLFNSAQSYQAEITE